MSKRVPYLASVIVLLATALAPAWSETELARGKPALASASAGKGAGPELALDGDSKTAWTSSASGPQWIRVDLGAKCSISRVSLSWDAASAKGYKVEVSDNGFSWKTVAELASMKAGARVDDLAKLAATGRYLRVYCSAATSMQGYSLIALKVFGSPAEGAKPAAAPAAPAKTAKPTKATKTAKTASGPFFAAGLGAPLPLGASGDILDPGVSGSLEFGRSSVLGPGRLGLGGQTGVVWESTEESANVSSPYDSFLVPLGVFVSYDIPIKGSVFASAKVAGGYSATMVNSEFEGSFGVLKPFAAARLGLGLDLKPSWSLQAGAEFLAVFYDDNAYLALAPQLGASFRF